MNSQIYIFIIFIFNGFLIGLLFDIFRILRKTIKTKDFITYIEDIIFWILSGIIVLYSVFKFNNGEIRLFIFTGIITGCLLYLLIFSKIFIKVSIYIISMIKKVINYTIIIPFSFIFKIVKKILIKPFTFIVFNLKKIMSYFKFKVKK